ncbi:outer membrane beta-barrel protein [uncultured Mucilaginibacter sp.]|uniref:outer membrane beta-barrel protein n=1 Tax=uncultured Mucilaginibacter sp. TaxID=797541 RepID=UPI00261CD86B|nr:outer membrane beta-barrel protein [uncultured Mucilaginibacter sp.]
MKKLFLMFTIVAVTASAVSAQRTTTKRKKAAMPTKFSVGLELGAPTGDAKNLYNVGFGGSGKIEIPATPQFAITATAGYTSFYLKDNVKNALNAFGIKAKPAGYIPLKAGGKYYVSPVFYVGGEIGAAIGIQQSTVGYGTLSGHGTAFAYAPGIGVSIPLIGKSAIDAGIRYEGWSQNGQLDQLALRVAYKF